MKIASFSTSTYKVPLLEEWGDQTHRVDSLEFVIVDIATDTGATGTGFSYTVGVGARSIQAMLDSYMLPSLEGTTADPRPTWHRLWHAFHDMGGGGVVTMAIAGIDIALWDLQGKVAGRSLVDLIGHFRTAIPAYASGINLNRDADALEEQVAGWVSKGYRAVKVKVGKPEPEEDLDRLRRLRQRIGPVPLMIDANQGWDRTRASSAIRLLEPVGPYWIEEPLLADDQDGHAALRREVAAHIAVGENLYTRYQFNEYLSRGACDFVQPDVVRVGGITPFLDIASLAASWNVPVAPHFLRELSGQLLCAIPNGIWLEDVDGGSFSELGLLESPLPVRDGVFSPPDSAGNGLHFDRESLVKYAM